MMTLTMSNFNLDTDESVLKFCKSVLTKRFPNDPLKQEIYESDSDKINFACPYCGDSARDPNKKRGNLYLKTQTYKCYNDGCMVWVRLDKFVAYFAEKYNLTVPSIAPKRVEFKPEVSVKKKGFLIEFLINREVGRSLLLLKDIVSRFSLVPCSEAEPESPIGRFVEKRKINRLPIFEKCCYYDSRQDKVYIFNLDIRSGRVLGFAIRKIDDSAPGPKYNIKGYSELKRNGLARELLDEFIAEVDQINNYFNILNVDFSKPIIIVEGQIDSMFLSNSIATTGVTKSKALMENLISKEKALIFFDNDKAGREQSIAFLTKGYRVFLWGTVLQDLKNKYPSSSKEIKSIKDVNDLFRFLILRDPALSFSKFNDFVNQYFSVSAFDILSV